MSETIGPKPTDELKVGDIFTLKGFDEKYLVTEVINKDNIKIEKLKSRLTQYDIDFLKGRWDGVGGAAYNEVYEFCYENGLCDRSGKITDIGRKALENA